MSNVSDVPDISNMSDMQIKPPVGSRKNKRIVGRGNSGRRGSTSGRGTKGQNSRSGGGTRLGFEGGQMPLYRRLPRRGFSNHPFKKTYQVLNLSLLENSFDDGDTVTTAVLRERGFIKGKKVLVKILANGEITKKLTLEVDAISEAAKTKIEKAGGSAKIEVKEGKINGE